MRGNSKILKLAPARSLFAGPMLELARPPAKLWACEQYDSQVPAYEPQDDVRNARHDGLGGALPDEQYGEPVRGLDEFSGE